MKLPAILILCTIMAIVLLQPLNADPLILDNSREEYLLWNHIELFTDGTDSVSVEQLDSVDWTPNQNPIIQYGLTGHTYWLRFSLDTRDCARRVYNLDTHDTQTHILELYQVKDSAVVPVQKAGRFNPDSFKFWNKPVVVIDPPQVNQITILKYKANRTSPLTPYCGLPSTIRPKSAIILFFTARITR
jgi:hypothetical protein